MAVAKITTQSVFSIQGIFSTVLSPKFRDNLAIVPVAHGYSSGRDPISPALFSVIQQKVGFLAVRGVLRAFSFFLQKESQRDFLVHKRHAKGNLLCLERAASNLWISFFGSTVLPQICLFRLRCLSLFFDLEIQHLPVMKQLSPKASEVNFLDGCLLADRMDCRRCGALAHNHEHRFHSNTSV